MVVLEEENKVEDNNIELEDFEPYYCKYYIATNEDGLIIDGWSNGPHPEKDITNAICINSKGSYQFRLCPEVEENAPLYNMQGIPIYKWDGEKAVERTQEEIAEDIKKIPAPPPSPQEQLRADVDFLAAMQGISL